MQPYSHPAPSPPDTSGSVSSSNFTDSNRRHRRPMHAPAASMSYQPHPISKVTVAPPVAEHVPESNTPSSGNRANHANQSRKNEANAARSSSSAQRKHSVADNLWGLHPVAPAGKTVLPSPTLLSYTGIQPGMQIMYGAGALSFPGHATNSAFKSTQSSQQLANYRKDEGQYVCEYCGKKLSDVVTLAAHLANHQTGIDLPPGSKLQCSLCQELFNDRTSLNSHACTFAFRNHHTAALMVNPAVQQAYLPFNSFPAPPTHPPPYTVHTCDHPRCGKMFYSIAELHQHKTEHEQPAAPTRRRKSSKGKKKRFVCAQCGTSFTRKYDLNIHIRRHTERAPVSKFACDQCGFSCNNKEEMTAHMNAHAEEKPFPCPTCGKRFARRTNVTRHMRTHTGEKPYQCEKCGKRFKVRHHLTGHMRTHTGEKPYACNRCGKRFNDRGNLNRHLKTHNK